MLLILNLILVLKRIKGSNITILTIETLILTIENNINTPTNPQNKLLLLLLLSHET